MITFRFLLPLVLLLLAHGHEVVTTEAQSRILLKSQKSRLLAFKLRGRDAPITHVSNNDGIQIDSTREASRGAPERRASERRDDCGDDDCMTWHNSTSEDHGWDDSDCRRFLQWNHSHAWNHSCDDDDCMDFVCSDGENCTHIWHCGNRTHDDWEKNEDWDHNSKDWDGSDEDCDDLDRELHSCDGQNCTRCGNSRNGTAGGLNDPSLTSTTASELSNSGSAGRAPLSGLVIASLLFMLKSVL